MGNAIYLCVVHDNIKNNNPKKYFKQTYQGQRVVGITIGSVRRTQMTKARGSFDHNWIASLFQFSPNFNYSGVDMNKLLNLYKRNFEIMSQVSQVGVDCVQAVARCQTEALQQSLNAVVGTLDCVTSQGASSQQKVRKSSEILQDAWQNSSANVKELTEILTRSNREVFEMLSGGMRESVSELQDIIPTETRRKTGSK